MTKCYRNLTNSNSIVEQIVGERMAKTMGIYPFFNSSFGGKTLEQVSDVDGLNRLGEVVFADTAENGRISDTVDAKLLSLHHPKVQVHLGGLVHTNHTHLVAFADYSQGRISGVVIAVAQSNDLTDPQPASPKHNK